MQQPTVASGFDRQLEAYSANSKSISSASNWRDRLGSWPMYAAATASALACSTSASAGIIYEAPDFSVSNGGTGNANQHYVPLKLQMYVSSAEGFFGRAVIGGYSGNPSPEILVTNRSYAKRLASGAVVSSLASFNGFAQLWREGNGHHTNGSWAASHETGYAGFKLKTVGSQYDYGWLKISVTPNGSGYPSDVTLIAYAYNDVAGQSITAGEVGTPEPSTKALMLLAAGFAGVLAWRRKATV